MNSMSTVRKVMSNSVWLVFCRIMKVLLAAVVSVFTARFLGTADFGLLNYSSAIVSFVSPFVLLGFNSILVKEIISDNSNAGTILGTAVITSLGASMVGIGICTALSWLIMPNDIVAVTVTAIYSVTLIFHATELIQYWFQAKYRAKTVAIVGLLSYAVISVYKIILLILRVGIYGFAISNAFDFFLISAILTYIYFKEGNPRLKFSFKTQRHLLHIGYMYAISSFMINVFTQVDKLMIKAALGDAQNGIYSVAASCSAMFVFMFVAIIDTMRPYILEGKKISDTVFEKRITLLYSVLIYFGLFLGFVILVSADLMIYLLYGASYRGAGTVLKILIWSTVLSCLGGAKDIWVLAENKQKYLLLLNALGIVSNIAINAALIPQIGIKGAAIATVITQFCSNIFFCVFIKDLRRNTVLMVKSLNPVPALKSLGKWRKETK